MGQERDGERGKSNNFDTSPFNFAHHWQTGGLNDDDENFLLQIGKLNKVVDAVRTEHTKLERDLDYLKTQQQEFEALLEPLENSLNAIPNPAAPEPEREHL